MSMAHLSRGPRRLLDRLLWRGRMFGRIQQSQEKLGKALGPSRRDPSSGRMKHGDVSERTVREYLRELKPFVEVEQGGDGNPASYFFTAALPSELTSGLAPGCFRAASGLAPGCFWAETEGASQHPSPNAEVADKNFRAETASCSLPLPSACTRSRCTVLESEQFPTAKTELEQAQFPQDQIEALKRHIRFCDFEPSESLLKKLSQKAEFWGVSLFAVSAHIERAWRKVANTSNRPRTEGWFTTVVENALASTIEVPAARGGTSVPTVAAIAHQISALAAQKGFGGASRRA